VTHHNMFATRPLTFSCIMVRLLLMSRIIQNRLTLAHVQEGPAL
jgi:hypothetical protein